MIYKIINCNPDLYEHETEKQAALSNIIQSHKNRNNIVICDNEIMKRVISSPLYMQHTKITANEIIESHREYIGASKSLETLTFIDFSTTNEISREKDSQDKITISYNFFVDFEYVSPTIFLAENTIDVKFYTHIAKLYSKCISGVNLDVKFRPFNGNGSGISLHIEEFNEAKKVCLCFVDSDLHHPKGPRGTTSSNINLKKLEDSKTCKVVITHMQEAESYIPLKLLEEIIVDKKMPAKIIDAFDSLNNVCTSHSNVRDFFDHKKGITLCKAKNLDNAHGNFWVAKLKDIPDFARSNCLKNGECEDVHNCPKLDGFGDDILKIAVEKLDTYNLKTLFSQLTEKERDSWAHIGRTIVSWGCTPVGRASRS